MKKNGIYLTCKVCGKAFYVSKNRAETSRWCSKECWNKRNPPLKKRCKQCGKEFETYGVERETKIFCSNECRNKAYIGKKASPETKKKMSIIKKGKIPKNAWKSGSQHPMWNPERTNQRERLINEYLNWRAFVYQRDQWTCQECGGVGRNLNAHHIKSFAKHPELRTDVNNGITLCEKCHKSVHKRQIIIDRWEKYTNKKAEKLE